MRIAGVIVLLVLGASAAWAQTKEQATARFGAVIVSRPGAGPAATNVVYRSVRHPKLTFSGALVQAVKSRRPFQLFNPFAPASYGSGGGNTSQDPATGRAEGARILTVSF